MAIKLGDPATKKQATGRLYFQRKTNGTLEVSWLDFGNCKAHKLAPDVQRNEHMASADGINTVDLSLVKSVKRLFQYELDEVTPDLERLRQLAGDPGADVVQAGAVVVAEQICNANSKQGRTVFTAKQGLSAYTVKIAGVAKVEGTDYLIDAGAGAIYIIPGGGIADNSTVTIDYTAAQVTTKQFTATSELLAEGNFKYIEKDQFNAAPREVTTFYGQCYVSNWGENNGEFNTTTLDALAWTKPVVSQRKD